VNVLQFSESENGTRSAELSVYARVWSDSSKWRMFVSIMHIFMKRNPKMPESGYRKLGVFGRSP
jgi:hypothetical protein